MYKGGVACSGTLQFYLEVCLPIVIGGDEEVNTFPPYQLFCSLRVQFTRVCSATKLMECTFSYIVIISQCLTNFLGEAATLRLASTDSGYLSGEPTILGLFLLDLCGL